MTTPTIAILSFPLVDEKTKQAISPWRWTYATKLSRLLVGLGFAIEWWQPGGGWIAQIVPGATLHGGLGTFDSQLLTWPRLSENFREKAAVADGAIYFDHVLAYPQVTERAIAISHGIHWDDVLFESRLGDDEARSEWRRRMWMTLTGPQKVVAVDTSMIQWATTTWPGLKYKFVYIPNFVPPERDLPPGAPSDDDDTFTVAFIAPLTPHDGIAETIRAITKLLPKHPRLNFIVGGSAKGNIGERLTQWAAHMSGAAPTTSVSSAAPPTSGRPARVVYDPQASVETVLSNADAVLFPAKSAQNTSALALQALAAGKPILVGPTGGLTDIVLHAHNGLVLQPGEAGIIAGIEYLLQDAARCKAVGAAARQTAKSFSLSLWRQRWKKVITEVFSFPSASGGNSTHTSQRVGEPT